MTSNKELQTGRNETALYVCRKDTGNENSLQKYKMLEFFSTYQQFRGS